MKQRLIKITTLLLFCFSALGSQAQIKEDIRPQVWNNIAVGWNIDEKFSIRGAAAYNVLLSREAPWNEITLSAAGVYKFHWFMEASLGFYMAATKQTENLRSFEYRPYIAYRIFTNDSKRWFVSNLSRLELRKFKYTDGTSDIAFRFRNRTYAVVALNKVAMIANKTLFLFGYFEAFYNFESEVKERFFNQFKYKLGLGYRLSYYWRFNIGVIYQDAIKNIEGPSLLPVTVNTNWILEWGVAYIFPPKKKN